MKVLFAFLLACCMFESLPCESKTVVDGSKKTDRIYVDSEAIKISEDGIFMSEHGRQVPVEIVGKDAKGVYVVTKGTITCYNCGLKFEPIHCGYKCPRCGRQN